ncbi:MAG TPA: UDP-N-acetylmuramate dehydrogenase [Flavitalea sp.]|nr:UDP-N-acetylmuramate dehydrogenase [Flavitalea sp.]
MKSEENISLRPYNTFRMDVHAGYFITCYNMEEIRMAVNANKDKSITVFGGGSNILLTKNIEGVVIKNEIRGINQIREEGHQVFVEAGAGENWHRFVLYCLDHNLGGVENLALIPGSVGASPMQNIGAYGVELSEVFHELLAYDTKEAKFKTFNREECLFGYRESIFKTKHKGRFIICKVVFRLTRKPIFNISYGAIRQELNAAEVKEVNIRSIAEAVIRIRRAKLPDPELIGNAGSFFKNPTVSASQFALLKEKFPLIVGFPNESGDVKLAAGWMIESCGWKGFRRGDAGCHAQQALVLVNYGNATGKEIFDLSEEILTSVKEKFGVELEREVNVL